MTSVQMVLKIRTSLSGLISSKLLIILDTSDVHRHREHILYQKNTLIENFFWSKMVNTLVINVVYISKIVSY